MNFLFNESNLLCCKPFLAGVVAHTCNVATLKAEIRASVGARPVGDKNLLLGG